MTDPKRMPERIWAFEIDCETLEGEYALANVWNDGVEYIRADLVGGIDVEDLAYELRDALFKRYALNADPGALENILTEAIGGQSDD